MQQLSRRVRLGATTALLLAGCGSVKAPWTPPPPLADGAVDGPRAEPDAAADVAMDVALPSRDAVPSSPADAITVPVFADASAPGPDSACAAGEHRCDAALLKVCSADRSGFVPVKTCSSAALCNPTVGDCTTSACAPMQYRCGKDVLQRCNADQTAFEPVQTCPAGLCDAGQRACLTCAKGERACASANQIRVCAPDGLTTSTESCAGGRPYCESARCTACKAGACGDGLCPADCASESPRTCIADCGGLPFAERNAQRQAGKDWSFGDFKGECGPFQALTGLSATVGSGRAHALLCSRDADGFRRDPQETGCRSLDFSRSNTAISSDWDFGFLKGECATDEFVAGVSQTVAAGAVKAILCCPGPVAHKACTTQVLYGGNAAEPGATDDTGDWDSGFTKGQCGPGRYVAGVSRFVAASGAAIDGAAHAILCCGR